MVTVFLQIQKGSRKFLLSYKGKRAAGNSSHTTENPAALFFLRNCSVPFSLINNPPVVGYYTVAAQLLSGYYPVIPLLLPGYFKA